MSADLRSRILAAIDWLQTGHMPVTSETVMAHAWGHGKDRQSVRRVPRELRAMSKAGIVVYDRKASGWRRA